MKQTTCNCSAYTFPHRLNGGQCQIKDLANHIEDVTRYNAVHEDIADYSHIAGNDFGAILAEMNADGQFE